MKELTCRACESKVKIIPKQLQEHDYPDGVLCLECWRKPTSIKLANSLSQSSTKSFEKSSEKSAFDLMEDNYNVEVGDWVYLNTKQYGVIKGQIIDSESFGEMYGNFFTIQYNDDRATYISDSEIFQTKEKALKSRPITFS